MRLSAPNGLANRAGTRISVVGMRKTRNTRTPVWLVLLCICGGTQCTAAPDAVAPEDLTIVVEADRSRIEARIAEIQKETQALNSEKKKLVDERSGLEAKLLQSLKEAGSPSAAQHERSLERFEGLVEQRSAEILAAIEKGGDPGETQALLLGLKQELRQRDEERQQQDRANEERLLSLMEAEKNAQLRELFLDMRNRFAARAQALEAREQKTVELLTAMQKDDGAELTRQLLGEMRAEMKERQRAFQVCEGQLLAASANDNLRMVLRGMLGRLTTIEKHLAVERVGRALRAPGNVPDAPAANRRQKALETARIDLAAKARSEPPTVKLGEKKAKRVQDLLDIGGQRIAGLDPVAVERVVRLRRRDLQYCHEAQQRRHPGLAGKIVISATVAASGRVARAEVSHNDTGSEGFGECMTQKIKRWRFPEPGQETTAVEIPFIIPKST